MNERTAVYRAFDKDGALLYVGIARNWARRWAQHSERSAFFSVSVRVEIEWLDSRDLALAREAEAIRSERPRFNVRHAGVVQAETPARESPAGLIGLFFHSMKDGVVEWQGHIVQRLSGDLYLVELFDWLMGCESVKKIVALDAMSEWRLYDSADEMRHYYDYVYSPQRERVEAAARSGRADV